MGKSVTAVIGILILAYVFFMPGGEQLGVEPAKVMAPEDKALPLLEGAYQPVAFRRASEVLGGPEDLSLDEGSLVSAEFGETLKWFDGSTCSDWEVAEIETLPLDILDPMLSDTQVPPNDPPISVGDRLQNKGVELTCQGKPFAVLVKIDERVLVSVTPSGNTYLILERLLTSGQILAFQEELKSMKFLTGEPKDVWTDEAMVAVGFWSEYKGAAYRFKRPAITENLLDGLGVLVPVSEISSE